MLNYYIFSALNKAASSAFCCGDQTYINTQNFKKNIYPNDDCSQSFCYPLTQLIVKMSSKKENGKIYILLAL